MAEAEGFEPPDPLGTLAFKASALGRSATLPPDSLATRLAGFHGVVAVCPTAIARRVVGSRGNTDELIPEAVVDFNPDAELDTSQVSDDRGSSGGGGGALGGRVALGGGGVSIVGLIIYLVLSQLGGGNLTGGLPSGLDGSESGSGSGGSVNGGQIAQNCHFGRDVSTDSDCEVVPIVNSIQNYWTTEFAQRGSKYVPAVTHVFSQATNTGCGSATADVGPFYCPADKNVYIDLSFYQELQTRFGAKGGPFARAYVLAHEYGHHVQDLIGTSRNVKAGVTGATSGSVRLELQADCYAGVWANHAQQTTSASGKPLIEHVSQADVAAAVDTASRIGDDYIQSKIGGQQVDQSEFTHGSSAQRQKWLTTGLRTGDPEQCDTFSRNVNLG
jgi:uncharacterized protein